MKALAVIVLAALAFYCLTVNLGIVTFLLACLIGWIIQQDRNDAMMNSFFAGCFALAVIGIFLTVLGF